MRPSSQRDSGDITVYPRPFSGGFLEIKAYAKINLFLDVVGKRPDGYHDILSIMQTVSLHDELMIRKTKEKSGFNFCTDSKEVPSDESNLVARAARLMIKEYKISGSFEIFLTKRIPVGAGLAGGSADCGAALVGIDRLFNLNVPPDELRCLARGLGADVPFCMTRGTCLARGVGNKLTPLSPHPDCAIVIVYPHIHVSTKEIFEKLEAGAKKQNKKLENMIISLRNKDLTGIANSLYNVFTDLTGGEFPIVKKMVGKLKTHGAIGASMTGTGSAVFGYFLDESDALAAMEALAVDARTFLVKPIDEFHS